MELLVASDIHCNKRHCESLVTQSKEVDIVIIAGDLASVRRGLLKTVEWLKPITKRVVLVPGNNETLEELQTACKDWGNVIVLHGNGTKINDQQFFGIGGGIPVTPFGDWSYDFTEYEAQQLLKDCPEHAILISHSPAKGILDVSSSGNRLGSIAVKQAIVEKKPKLVICGHIHESGGKKEHFGSSLIINAGPAGMRVTI